VRTVRVSLYDGYGELKDWSVRFVCGEADAAYFAGELAGLRLAGSTVLEIGFGSGAFLAWARAQGAIVEGTELSPTVVDAARHAGFTAHGPDLAALLPDRAGRFDLVVAFDVLEHVEREALPMLMGQVGALLKPGGRFLARVPNGQSPLGLLHQNGDITHVSALSVPIFRHLALMTGLTLERADNAFRTIPIGRRRQGWGQLKRTVRWRLRYRLRDLHTAVLRWLYALEPMPFDPNLVVVLRKPGGSGDP